MQAGTHQAQSSQLRQQPGGLCAVIVSYHTGPALWACIQAALGDPEIAQVVVVDNGNPPAATEQLHALAANRTGLTVLSGHGNIGFSAGCNLGAAAAAGSTLLFLNPDLELRAGAVRALLRTLDQADPGGPVVVGGRLLCPDGSEQRGARRDHITPWSALVAMTGLGKLERIAPVFRDPHRERDPVPVGPQRVGAVSGAMLLMRRGDFEAVGGFDPSYFLHVEDLDLCRRVWAAGGEVVFAPDAEGVHIGRTSRASGVFVERCKAQGFARYFARFAASPLERAAAAVLAPLLGAALLTRGFLRDLPRLLRVSRADAVDGSSWSPPRRRQARRAPA
jgi:hypothetical protein